MESAAASALTRWDTFYLIVGSAAAALTGLQFVVIALIAELRVPGSMQEVSTFGTPTIMHFSAVLLISAVVSAPWPTPLGVGLTLAAIGVAGVAYIVVTGLRARRTAYQPYAEDWIWYVILPMLAHATLLVSGLLVARRLAFALFLVGSATLLLLFVGIHNAWDSVTYIALERRPSEGRPE